MQDTKQIVTLESIFESPEWQDSNARLPLALGKDINGNVVVPDLALLPHLLIAGTTGSGKSVCINSIILGLLKKYSPAELNFIMADLKVVELCDYKNLPHLQFPVLTEHKEILHSLKWCVEEIHRSSMILAASDCQQLYDYNKVSNKKLPYIVFILDELADLMVNDNKLAEKVENVIVKICQKGHSVGIHMIISTVRPSNQVITNSIARNIPSRLAFRTVSNTCSKVILGEFGAEKLSGCGDMLALLPPNQDLIQIQGAYASYEDIQQSVPHPPQKIDPLDFHADASDDVSTDFQQYLRPGDTYGFQLAIELVISTGKATISHLQRNMKIGYNRAAEYMDLLRERGVIKK